MHIYQKNSIAGITATLICMLFACTCTNWAYNHVLNIDGAFLFDSVTAGIVATEWDADIPSSAWKESSEFNVKQKLYKYAFTSGNITEIADLVATSPTGVGKADYSYPWVVYCTYVSGFRKHALYSIKEKQGFVLDEKTEIIPVEICPGGYFVYQKMSGCGENNTKSSYVVYAINERKVIAQFCPPQEPFFVDSTGTSVLLLQEMEGSAWPSTRHRIVRYWLNDNRLDTIATLTDKLGIRVGNFGATCFMLNSKNPLPIEYCSVQDLMAKRCDFKELNVSFTDIALSTGNWVLDYKDKIVVGNLSQEEESVIMQYAVTKR